MQEDRSRSRWPWSALPFPSTGRDIAPLESSSDSDHSARPTLAVEPLEDYVCPMSVADIKNAVAALADRDRAELAAWLLDSLPSPAFGDETDDGVQEAARRREELDSGRVELLPAEEFWADVDRARSRWK